MKRQCGGDGEAERDRASIVTNELEPECPGRRGEQADLDCGFSIAREEREVTPEQHHEGDGGRRRRACIHSLREAAGQDREPRAFDHSQRALDGRGRHVQPRAERAGQPEVANRIERERLRKHGLEAMRLRDNSHPQQVVADEPHSIRKPDQEPERDREDRKDERPPARQPFESGKAETADGRVQSGDRDDERSPAQPGREEPRRIQPPEVHGGQGERDGPQQRHQGQDAGQ